MHYNPPEESLYDDTLVGEEAVGNDAALKDQAISFRVFETELYEARAKAAKTAEIQKGAKGRLQRDLGHVPQSAPVSVFRRNVSNPEAGSSGNKTKRKVTFNAELAVRTIERSASGRKAKRSNKNRNTTGIEGELACIFRRYQI
jgi:hypothetical protein